MYKYLISVLKLEEVTLENVLKPFQSTSTLKYLKVLVP